MADEQLKVLSRADILNAEDTRIEDVPVPEWGGVVRVRGLKGVERDAYEASIMTHNDETGQFIPTLENARAKLVVRSAVDADGKPLFKENDLFDLGNKSAAALQRVWAKARELSGLSEEDVKKLVKNSKAAQSEDSSSDSPSPSVAEQ